MRIPGANNAVYTTPPTVAGDDGSRYYAVVQGRDGRQTSDEVMLSIFAPSATESVGWSFRGSGANGAPTDMLPTDITGFHPQAYWNNLAGGSGKGPATNSTNVLHPSITITWATSGEWGAGTGNSDPLERMLNGMATSFSTTEAGAQTVTLSGVPAGSHSVFLYTVQVPQEFFNMDFAVTAGGVTQQRFIRPLNSEEYNPTPGFSLVTADTAASRGVGNFMRFDNLSPGSDGNIVITFSSPGRVDLPGGDPIRGPGLNGLQLIEQINESHKSGVVLSRKTKRELTETLRVATRFAGEEKLRETQKALDAFEKKVRAQVAPTEPEAARAWILWSQAVSDGMEKCIKPPRKSKDHHDDKKDDDKKDDPR